MSINIDARLIQLAKLKELISSSRKKLIEITSELQWDIDTLAQGKEMVVCPFDEGHVIPKESLERHVDKCKLSKGNYHHEDIPFPPLSVDPNSPSVLNVDSKLQASILRLAKEKNPAMLIGFPGQEDDRSVPLSSDRFMSSLTSDEKSALHSYVISNTVSPGEVKAISLAEQDLEINFKNKKEEKKAKTHLERLIEERDAKRRKEGKKVHINRKSHTEIIREVIDNQMEVYVEWLKEENLIPKDESETTKVESLSDPLLEDQFNKQDQDEMAGNSSKDQTELWDSYDQRERNRDRRHNRDVRKQEVNFGRSRWQNNRTFHSQEEDGYKRHRDYDSVRSREPDSSHYKEHYYNKNSKKRHRENRRDEYDKIKASNYEESSNWSDAEYISKDEFNEQNERHSSKKKHKHRDFSRERRKEERGTKHHRSRKRCSQDSDDDHKSKHKKKEKHSKRDS